MRQDHRAGEKLFVDYAGQTMPVIDPRTGELRQAQIFVAVLGASNYTYAEATWTQSLPDWIGSHQRCLQHLGGVPMLLIPDNLRSGVSQRPSLRAGPQPHLSGDGGPLRRRGGAGAGTQAEGQGQGRDRRASGRALDPGSPAPPHLLLPGRAQPGHRRAAGAAQYPAVSQTGGVSPEHCSTPSTPRRCSPCRPRPTPTPNGRRSGSISTTTSSSTATTTRCPIS